MCRHLIETDVLNVRTYGTIFAFFLILFGTYRIIVEFYRISIPVFFFTLAQVISIIIVIAGSLVMLAILTGRR